MAEHPEKVDPIRDRYFKPLEVAEKTGDGLFYGAAVLSIVAVATPKDTYPGIFATAQILFLITTVLGLVIGLAIRLYWTPRAQGMRTEDFFSEAFGIALTHERTKKYYNNEATEPARRIGLQLLENTHFTKAIVLRMCKAERIQIVTYAVMWLAIVLLRATPIDLVVAISQVLFSEQLISRFARMEWLRMKVEGLYASTYRILQSGAKDRASEAAIITNMVAYESAKANAAITTSSKIFQELNSELSREWEEIKKGLGAQ
jgi:hypothetical protein